MPPKYERSYTDVAPKDRRYHSYHCSIVAVLLPSLVASIETRHGIVVSTGAGTTKAVLLTSNFQLEGLQVHLRQGLPSVQTSFPLSHASFLHLGPATEMAWAYAKSTKKQIHHVSVSNGQMPKKAMSCVRMAPAESRTGAVVDSAQP